MREVSCFRGRRGRRVGGNVVPNDGKFHLQTARIVTTFREEASFFKKRGIYYVYIAIFSPLLDFPGIQDHVLH